MTTPTSDQSAPTNAFSNPSPVAQQETTSPFHHAHDAEPAVSGAQQSHPEQRDSSDSRVVGMSGPVGEPGLPPSRPSSIATSQSGGNQKRWSQAPPLRRPGGVPAAFGASSVAGSAGGHSRPTTSASRTHVPSIASHAFYRPMSSQRLQAQRGQRPTSFLGQSSVYSEGASEGGGNAHRQSSGSNQTVKNTLPIGLHHDLDHRPSPPSRGTDITDRDIPDRTTANTTPTGAETVRSRGESIAPLQRPTRPTHLDLSAAHKNDSGKLPTPSKSPRSFRSSFILPNRGGSAQMRPQTGHEKLASAESSPRMSRKDKSKEVVKQELGKNHEYFEGNTVFWGGGRFQNSRDRPVNVGTGIMIIVPAGLFFGFS